MDKTTIYKDGKGEWRWTRKARNGRVVGAAHEGFKRRRHCVANAIRNGNTIDENEA